MFISNLYFKCAQRMYKNGSHDSISEKKHNILLNEKNKQSWSTLEFTCKDQSRPFLCTYSSVDQLPHPWAHQGSDPAPTCSPDLSSHYQTWTPLAPLSTSKSQSCLTTSHLGALQGLKVTSPLHKPKMEALNFPNRVSGIKLPLAWSRTAPWPLTHNSHHKSAHLKQIKNVAFTLPKANLSETTKGPGAQKS